VKSGMNELKRLVLDYRTDELVVRCLYRSEDGPGPNTKRRWREVRELALEGLRQALASLEGRVDIGGLRRELGFEGADQYAPVLMTSPSVSRVTENPDFMSRFAWGSDVCGDYERPSCGYAAVASACHARTSERNRSSSLLPTLLMRLFFSRGSFFSS
jgi:hypothetical protein